MEKGYKVKVIVAQRGALQPIAAIHVHKRYKNLHTNSPT